MSETVDQSDHVDLPRSITILEKYGFTRRVEVTADNMASDFFVEFEELPSDLLIPAIVFFGVRDVNGSVLSISRSVKRNPAITGLVDSTDPSKTRDLSDLNALPRVVDITDTEEEPLSTVEIVIEQSTGKPILDSSECRYLDSMDYQITNLHDHSHTNGISVYLRDPSEQIKTAGDTDWKTMAELLK